MSHNLPENLGLENYINDGVLAAAVIGKEVIASGADSTPNVSPVDGREIIRIQTASPAETALAAGRATAAFRELRRIPAPRRGELVRRIGEILRERKNALGELVSLEAGKIQVEARGEVQEWIDICDFAVGLSRQLYGLTITSERPRHRMMEQWHPLGPVGVISAFNFPVAVWAWNSMLAFVCGDSVVWKPSEKTPLCAFACHQVVQEALQDFPEFPPEISSILVGRTRVGQSMAADKRFPLISATGSVKMGRAVGATVGARLGRSLLELGGNNGMIVSETVDLSLAMRAIVFSAVGTTGQRCTSLRRLFVHETVQEELYSGLIKAYEQLPIGDPRDPSTLLGPLIDEAAFIQMGRALAAVESQAGKILYGGERIISGVPDGGYYVRPALVEIRGDAPPWYPKRPLPPYCT